MTPGALPDPHGNKAQQRGWLRQTTRGTRRTTTSPRGVS